MPIDPNLALGVQLSPGEFRWSTDDVVRYHLAIGAGARDDTRELRYVYQPDRVLPTFGMTAPAALGIAAPSLYAAESPEIRQPGVELALTALVHARQEIVVHQPLPVDGIATSHARIVDIYDKGSAAILVQQAELIDPRGNLLLSYASEMFARGEGGFGGSRGPSLAEQHIAPPEREADAVLDLPILPQQAALYRLCGENNPVHIDPAYARRAGFRAPILQGVCLYAMVCKAVVDALLDADPTVIKRYTARFAGIVYPGENVRVHIWRAGNRLVFTAMVTGQETRSVLADCVIDF
ncbi:MAG: 3-alpha,7-alpha,12-alpha-trihydroxy-5-beta-cholest-24-enoyl-CoA hydratase [Corynebacteriales bacterium]|nr:3-alpha,7-alpha,12-alpha-trihydroxy-5-beta-cholest-24-enoyl-CoA hydratase [Mycobacteriales bacterium]